MITRAKPKFLTENDLEISQSHGEANNEGLYFSSGRAALFFMLDSTAKNLKKGLRVGMQSFNCEVVAQAAKDTNCTVVLMDIELDSFSISLHELQRVSDEIDVLLLTHYQGIPNPYYHEIAKLCDEKDILLIEDLAHTHESSIYNFECGSLGDASIYSFAFDKPFTAYKGGLLTLGEKLSKSLKNDLISAYSRVEFETDKEYQFQMKSLKLMWQISDVSIYRQFSNSYNVVEAAVRLRISAKLLSRLSTFKPIIFVLVALNRLLSVPENTMPKKMHTKKISLIENQICRFNIGISSEKVQQICTKHEIKLPKFSSSSIVNWNRLSVLDDEKSTLRNKLIQSGIEAGNFNWPKCIHQIRSYASFKKNGSLKNSEIASRQICNIPIWN